MKKSLIALFAALTAAAVVSAAPVPEYIAADASPAFTITLDQSGVAGKFVVTTNGAANDMAVIIGTTTNTVAGDSTIDTVAELRAALEACIYVSGTTTTTPIVVDSQYSLTTDSTDGELLDGTYTLTNGTITSVMYDTSTALHYSLSARGGMLKSVAGDVGGTGDITLSIYSGGNLVWNETQYAGVFNSVATTQLKAVQLNREFSDGLYIPNRMLIRATRGTTATTGGFTAVIDR
jgi:hypothetical protein